MDKQNTAGNINHFPLVHKEQKSLVFSARSRKNFSPNFMLELNLKK
jgi:hypothetical protein